MEFEVGGKKYRNDKLSAMQQFHVARRLGTVAVNSLGAILELMDKAGTMENLLKANFTEMVPVAAQLVKAVGDMSNTDADYVVVTCLSSVLRQQEGGAWARVQDGSGGMMFNDIDLARMLQIVGEVLRDNFASFFADLSSASPAAVVGGQKSSG